MIASDTHTKNAFKRGGGPLQTPSFVRWQGIATMSELTLICIGDMTLQIYRWASFLFTRPILLEGGNEWSQEEEGAKERSCSWEKVSSRSQRPLSIRVYFAIMIGGVWGVSVGYQGVLRLIETAECRQTASLLATRMHIICICMA